MSKKLNKNNNNFDYFEFSLKQGPLTTENNFRNFYFISSFLIFIINSVVFNVSLKINIFLTVFLFCIYLLIIIFTKFINIISLFKNMDILENIVSVFLFFFITIYLYVYFMSFYNFELHFYDRIFVAG